MRLTALALPCLIAASLAGTPVAAAIPTTPDAKTAEAVQAADDAWGKAEADGDAAYVDWLLLPGYQSVGPAGTSADKAKIVGGAKAHADPEKRAAMVAAWKANHPSRAAVALYGDTAVLTWVSTQSASSLPIYSCDIFTYRDGHWHGVYSQHTTAGT